MQRNSSLVILGNMGMPGHTHLKYDSINLMKPSMFNYRQKINFILHVFLEVLEKYCKLLLGFLGIPGYAHPKWCYQLVENFHVYLQTKNQLHHPHFFANVAKIWRLLILLGTSDQLVEHFDFHLYAKNKLHHLLLS